MPQPGLFDDLDPAVTTEPKPRSGGMFDDLDPDKTYHRDRLKKYLDSESVYDQGMLRTLQDNAATEVNGSQSDIDKGNQLNRALNPLTKEQLSAQPSNGASIGPDSRSLYQKTKDLGHAGVLGVKAGALNAAAAIDSTLNAIPIPSPYMPYENRGGFTLFPDEQMQNVHDLAKEANAPIANLEGAQGGFSGAGRMAGESVGYLDPFTAPVLAFGQGRRDVLDTTGDGVLANGDQTKANVVGLASGLGATLAPGTGRAVGGTISKAAPRFIAPVAEAATAGTAFIAPQAIATGAVAGDDTRLQEQARGEINALPEGVATMTGLGLLPRVPSLISKLRRSQAKDWATDKPPEKSTLGDNLKPGELFSDLDPANPPIKDAANLDTQRPDLQHGVVNEAVLPEQHGVVSRGAPETLKVSTPNQGKEEISNEKDQESQVGRQGQGQSKVEKDRSHVLNDSAVPSPDVKTGGGATRETFGAPEGEHQPNDLVDVYVPSSKKTIRAQVETINPDGTLRLKTESGSMLPRVAGHRVTKVQDERAPPVAGAGTNEARAHDVEKARAHDTDSDFTDLTETAPAPIASAQTGKPFTTKGWRGEGKPKSEVYNYSDNPAFGDGKYVAGERKDAQEYGDNLTQHDITLGNPLVVRTDAEWRALSKAAGWRFPNPFGMDRAEVSSYGAKIRDEVTRRGHDGLVIDPDPSGDSAKSLWNVAGHSQVISYAKEKEPVSGARVDIADQPKVAPAAIEKAAPAEPVKNSSFSTGQRLRFAKGKRQGVEVTVHAVRPDGRPVLRGDDGKLMGEAHGISPDTLEPAHAGRDRGAKELQQPSVAAVDTSTKPDLVAPTTDAVSTASHTPSPSDVEPAKAKTTDRSQPVDLPGTEASARDEVAPAVEPKKVADNARANTLDKLSEKMRADGDAIHNRGGLGEEVPNVGPSAAAAEAAAYVPEQAVRKMGSKWWVKQVSGNDFQTPFDTRKAAIEKANEHKSFIERQAEASQSPPLRDLEGSHVAIDAPKSETGAGQTLADFDTRTKERRDELLNSHRKANERYKTNPSSGSASYADDLNRQLKGWAMSRAAERRKLVQGDSIVHTEGGLTPKELKAVRDRLQSNYVGKPVILKDGTQGTVTGMAFGKVRVKGEDGKVRGYEADDIRPRNEEESQGSPTRDLEGSHVAIDAPKSGSLGGKELHRQWDKVTGGRGKEEAKPSPDAGDEGEHQASVLRDAGDRIQVDPLPGGTPKKTKDILLDFQKAIGKPVRIGKVPVGAGGAYFPGTSKTVVKYHGDIGTTAHELAHSLDDEFGIVGEWAKKATSPYDSELEQFWKHGSEPGDNLSPAAAQTYRRAEGVAEYLHAALINPKAAREAAPEFSKFIKDKLPNEVRKALNNFSDDVRSWAGQSSMERTAANIRDIGGVSDKTITAKLRDQLRGEHGDVFRYGFPDRAKEQVQDALWPAIKGVRAAKEARGMQDLHPENDPEVLMRLVGGANDVMSEILDHGPVDLDGKVRDGIGGGADWLLDWADTTSQATIKRDSLMAAAVGISERVGDEVKKIHAKTNEKLAEADPSRHREIISDMKERMDRLTGAGGGIFSDVAEAKRSLLEFSRMPAKDQARIREGVKRLRAWSDATLRHLVDADILSEERYQKIKQENPHYIDMHRVFENEKIGDALKSFKGSTRQLDNPFVNTLAMTDAIYRQAAHNMALKSFRDLLTSDRSMYDGKPVALDEIGRKIDDSEGGGTIIRVKGKPERWQFQPDIQRALDGWGQIDGPSGFLDKILRLPGQMLRYGVTHAPPFLLRNAWRDAFNRGIVSSNGSKPWDIFHKIDKNDYQAYRRAGGGQAGHYLSDKVDYHQEMAKRVKELAGDGKTVLALPGKAVNAWHEFAKSSELIGRMAEYRAALKKAKAMGYSDRSANLYAAAQSRGLLDYAIAGSFMKKVARYIPFLNAQVQGLHRSYTAAKSNPKAFAARWSVYVLSTSLAFKGMQAATESTQDTEDYRQLPAWRKDMFWNIKIGADRWLSLPKPFELGAMAAPIERMIDQVRGDEHAFDGVVGSMVKSVMPIDDGTLAGPLRSTVEDMTNWDFFRDKHIVPTFEESKELSLRTGTKNSSKLGQSLQAILGVDARHIDHWIRGTLGTGGGMALAASDAISGSDRTSTDGLLQSFAGLTTTTPTYSARDVDWVMKEADRRGEGQKKPVRHLQGLLREAITEKDPVEQTKKAAEARRVASALRKLYESRGPVVPRR